MRLAPSASRTCQSAMRPTTGWVPSSTPLSRRLALAWLLYTLTCACACWRCTWRREVMWAIGRLLQLAWYQKYASFFMLRSKLTRPLSLKPGRSPSLRPAEGKSKPTQMKFAHSQGRAASWGHAASWYRAWYCSGCQRASGLGRRGGSSCCSALPPAPYSLTDSGVDGRRARFPSRKGPRPPNSPSYQPKYTFEPTASVCVACGPSMGAQQLAYAASGVFNFAQGAMVLFAALAMARFAEWIPKWTGIDNPIVANLAAFVIAGAIMFVVAWLRASCP
eukprot:gene37364-46100_t